MKKKANAFKVLQILHAALFAGMFMFALGAIFVVHQQTPALADPATKKTMQVVATIAAIVLVSTAFTLFNKRIQVIDMEANATARMDAYRAAAIIRWGMIDGAGLFAIIAFFLTGSYACLALAGAIVFVFATTAPLKGKIIVQLQLDDNEVIQLEDAS